MTLLPSNACDSCDTLGKTESRHASLLPTSTSPRAARQPCARSVIDHPNGPAIHEFSYIDNIHCVLSKTNNSNSDSGINRIPPCALLRSRQRLLALSVKTRRPSSARIVSKPDTPNEKLSCCMGYNTKRHDRVEVTLNSSVPSLNLEMAEDINHTHAIFRVRAQTNSQITPLQTKPSKFQ